jgi:alanyl-tRNA synthetase
MGSLMKQTLSKLGGRGGGSKDMAQGGLSDPATIDAALQAGVAALKA